MPDSRVAYAQGDVILVPFPYTDLSAAKQRPALVLSNAAFNAASPDLVVCAMTSNLMDSGHSVLVGPQDMETGALKVPSRVKVGNVASLEKRIVRKRLGRVKATAFAQVMREFETLFT